MLPMLALLAGQGCGGGTATAPVRSEAGPASTPAVQVEHAQPAAESTPRHIVQRGDTLYSIAWRYQHDYRDVARWNNINPPYTIYPGQALRLTPPPTAGQTAKPAISKAAVNKTHTNKTKTKPARSLQPGPIFAQQLSTKTTGQTPTKAQDKAAAQAPAKPQPVTQDKPRGRTENKPAPQAVVANITWQWPASAGLLKTGGGRASKGVDFGGQPGQQILAAAAGEVVYSGSGLLGYGKLIIIKHNERYLSAYAYNKKLLVREGQRVAAGQQIATMGIGIKGQPTLHFEIRKDGKPTDPLRYLPRRKT